MFSFLIGNCYAIGYCGGGGWWVVVVGGGGGWWLLKASKPSAEELFHRELIQTRICHVFN